MFWYLQRDFLSLIREFSGGKLKQKGFFHSVRSGAVTDRVYGAVSPEENIGTMSRKRGSIYGTSTSSTCTKKYSLIGSNSFLFYRGGGGGGLIGLPHKKK